MMLVQLIEITLAALLTVSKKTNRRRGKIDQRTCLCGCLKVGVQVISRDDAMID